jgi:hypothetical protein
MRAMFVVCCLGLLVSAVASPAHARAFCQLKDCQTSVQKAARRHTATAVHKLSPKRIAHAPKHAVTHTASAHVPKHTVTHTASAHVPRQTATHTASVHAPRHLATATPKHPVFHSAARSVQATKTVSRPHPVRSASRECASGEVCDDVVSGGSQLIRLALEHLGKNPTGWAHNWCGRFLAMTLEEAGHTGGGNLAAGYADYGLPAKAQVGAIAVMSHHVGIVTAVGPDYVVLVSGNHGHKVGVGRYASNKIIAYRMAA